MHIRGIFRIKALKVRCKLVRLVFKKCLNRGLIDCLVIGQFIQSPLSPLSLYLSIYLSIVLSLSLYSSLSLFLSCYMKLSKPFTPLTLKLHLKQEFNFFNRQDKDF